MKKKAKGDKMQWRTIVITSLCWIAFGAIFSMVEATEKAPTLAISTASDRYEMGQEVTLIVEVNNNSRRTLEWFRGKAVERHYLILAFKDGKRVPIRNEERHKASDVVSAFRFELEPGEIWTESLPLSEMISLDKPGEYMVRLQIGERRRKSLIQSNWITLTIE